MPMEKTAFKIYVDRLKEGESEEIREELSSDFIEVSEQDLSFPDRVEIKGEAYLANDHLVLHLNIRTNALITCAICNQATTYPIAIADHYHSEPLNELENPVFEYRELIREAILLKVPPFLECQGGNCPERATVNKFLKKEDPRVTDSSKTNFPFEDLKNF